MKQEEEEEKERRKKGGSEHALDGQCIDEHNSQVIVVISQFKNSWICLLKKGCEQGVKLNCILRIKK
jgi:hypothetical protein